MSRHDTWPEDLLPAYFSRMTADTLLQRSKKEVGPNVILFPATGHPILVPAPVQYGYQDSENIRPIDLDMMPYLDLDDKRVVPLSSRMAIYARMPLDSVATLRVGFVVYHCDQVRLFHLHRWI